MTATYCPPPRARRGFYTLVRTAVLLLACSGAAALATDAAPAPEPATRRQPPRDGRSLADLTLEELMAIEITSVSKKPQKWSDVPAALYVITRDDVRRSGVRTLADALRLAPGVHVARIDTNKWAVAVRGFSNRLSRSVLVLIDGRAVYSPLFAGTFWEVQDTLLEDVDRIEVIRGPGGAIYGANAVNGVINIITRSAHDTKGVYASAGAGLEERGFGGMRYGGALGESGAFRVYAKFFDRDASYHRSDADFDDRWRQLQGGFRTDSDLGRDRITFQGDAYVGIAGDRRDISFYDDPFFEEKEGKIHLAGGNVITRWTHQLDGGSDVRAQMYFDVTRRRELHFQEERETFDIEIQHRVPLPLRQELIYGAGYRVSTGLAHAVETIEFDPERRTENLFSFFVQDEIELVPELLILTLGSKFEHNDYSGFEVHPSARIALTPAPSHLLWAAVSRAVRTPSRVDHDLEATIFGLPSVYLRQIGDNHFNSENLLAFEAGYRFQPVPTLAFDIAAFHYRYSDLESPDFGTPFIETPSGLPPRLILPVFLRNDFDAKSYGIEVSADWAVFDWWQLRGVYSFLELDLSRLSKEQRRQIEGASPANQASIRSYMDLPYDLQLDLVVRFVDRLPSRDVRAYTTFDARIGWRPTPNVEIALVGQNLAERHHPEFPGDGSSGLSGIEPSVYFEVTGRW